MPALKRAALLALVIAPLMLSAACDNNARFNPSYVRFDRVATLGVFPATKTPTGWQRQCGAEPADAWMVEVALLSTSRREHLATGGPIDRDLSIRPGDTVNGRTVEGPRPGDPKLSTPGHISVDLTGPAALPAQAVETGWVPRTSARGQGLDVVFLVDMSGSAKGLVDAETLREGSRTSDLPQDLTLVASDFSSERLAAIKAVLESFSPDDRIGIVGFGEGLGGSFLKTACALPEAEGLSWDAALDLCLSASNRDVWRQGLDALNGDVAAGRANLWDAVVRLRERMATWPATAQRARHLVVVSDGPDTCAEGERATPCTPACTSVDVGDALASVRGATQAIPTHFVQFESLGYPGPDARQQQVACESGGHYRFLASNALAVNSGRVFRTTLERVLHEIRYSMGGHWQAVFRVPGADGLETGALHALEGSLRVLAEAGLANEDLLEIWPPSRNAGLEDGPLVRRPCADDAACGLTSAACYVGCSAETLLCADADLPDGTSCESGICCEGACGGPICAACQSPASRPE